MRSRLAIALLMVLHPARAAAAPEVKRFPSMEEARTLDFVECDAYVAEYPDERRSYACYYRVARLQDRYEEGRDHLEAFVESHPDLPYARYTLGNLLYDLGEATRAAELMGQALAELDGRPDVEPGALATLILDYASAQRSTGEFAEAERWFIRAATLGRQSTDPVLAAAAEMEQGRTILTQGGDLARARTLFESAARVLDDDVAYTLRVKLLVSYAEFEQFTGRYERARAMREAARDLAREKGDGYVEAMMLASLVRWRPGDGALDDPLARARMRPMAREALEVAEAAGNRHAAARSRCLLGALANDPAESIEHYRACADAFDSLGWVEGRARATMNVASLISTLHPERVDEALALLDRESDEATADGRVLTRAMAHMARAQILWGAGHEDAVAFSLEVLDEVELLRDIQTDEGDRSTAFDDHALPFYLLSGALLGAEERSEEDEDLAFRTIERLRARALLEQMVRADADPIDRDDPAVAARDDVLRRMAAVQRKLATPTLPDETRRAALAQLARLEAEERQARVEVQRRSESGGDLVRPELPSLAQVQASLAPDEAILSYQLANAASRTGDPEGGAWLMAIHRSGVFVHRMPERRALRAQVPMLAGLVQRRDGSEAAGLARLHADLVAPVLAELPDAVERLTVVPDGVLYDVPFGALAAGPDAPPLAATHEVSVVPSIAALMQWRGRDTQPAAGLLAFAPPSRDGPVASSRGGTLATGLELGALPRAREEAEAVVAMWGEGRLLSAAEASERTLEETDLAPFGVLHFAAHAVLDREHPARSAVVLSPGHADEDGLLQPREILDLPLQGQVVVLSACSGASGAPVRGEGVMSLARAFLHAGAQAVVASRWPLSDSDARLLFDRLYHHLDTGETLAGALRKAQLELRDAGAPTAAWAGVVVLGRGDLVLRPRTWWDDVQRDLAARPWLLGLLVLVAAAVAWAVAGTRRARRPATT